MQPTEHSQERLKMAVLYFLSSIVIGQTKTGADATPVESFFLRAVDDLKFCKSFLWERLSFDHMLGEIKHTMTHFGRVVKENVLWPIPGFCIPMEVLAFEAIPELENKFRECIPGADENCPRMCKTRFKKSEMKGFPLSKINEELDTIKDIESILVARGEENSLMAKITEKDDANDNHDVVIASWMKRLQSGYTVSFEEMYNQDVASRLEEEPVNAMNDDITANKIPENTVLAELVDVVKTMKTEMGERMQTIEDMFVAMDKRVTPLEAYVKKQLGKNSKAPASQDPSNGHDAASQYPPKNKKGVKRTVPAGVDNDPTMRMTKLKDK